MIMSNRAKLIFFSPKEYKYGKITLRKATVGSFHVQPSIFRSTTIYWESLTCQALF